MIPYLQTTPFTTAASSLLTILHYFKSEVALTRENEFLIWQRTVTLPTRGSSIFALACYAKEQGLNPLVVIENKDYDFPDYRFYGYKKKDILLASFSSKLYLQHAEKLKIPIEQRKISFEDIETSLKEKKILLLRINAKTIRQGLRRNTSNYVVVFGLQGDNFQMVDPVMGLLSLSRKMMEDAFYSIETKKHQDHRMVIFSS